MAGRNPKDDDAHRAARARQSRPTGAGRPSARARRGAVSGRGRQGRPSADGGASAPHGGATRQSRPRQDARPPHRDGSGRPAGQRGASTAARGAGPRGGASRSGAPRDAGSRSGSRGGSARSSTSPRGFAAPGRGSTPRGSTHRGGSAKGAGSRGNTPRSAGSRGNAPRTGSASRTGVFTSGSALKAAAWPDDSRGSSSRSASSRGARSRDRSQDRGRGRGRPPRPAPKPRYWLRRLSVLLILIGLLAAVGYGILTAAAWTRATIRQQDEQAAADSVVTVYPDPVACPRSSLDVAINVPAETTVGAGLTIGATVTNTGSEACLLDVGGASLGAVIASGTDTVWTSTTCPAEPTSRMLLIT